MSEQDTANSGECFYNVSTCEDRIREYLDGIGQRDAQALAIAMLADAVREHGAANWLKSYPFNVGS